MSGSLSGVCLWELIIHISSIFVSMRATLRSVLHCYSVHAYVQHGTARKGMTFYCGCCCAGNGSGSSSGSSSKSGSSESDSSGSSSNACKQYKVKRMWSSAHSKPRPATSGSHARAQYTIDIYDNVG